MILSFTCNGLTRRIQRVENAVVAVRQDSAVDTVRMIFRPEEFNNISLATVSVKFLYVDNTDGEIKAYQTGTTPDGGVYVADWELTDDVVDDAGYINFAVKLAVVNGDAVEKQWFSIPDTFRVYDSVDDTNNPPGETAAEQATNAEKIAQLQSQLGTATDELSSLASTVALHDTALDTIVANYKNLGATTAIPSNSDLDSYTTPGSYSAQSNNIAATIAHAPIARAFTLDVENALGSSSSAWRRQVLRASASPDEVYQRFTGGNAWSDWEKVPTRAEVNTLNSNSVTNYSRTCEDCNTATSVGSYHISQLSTCANTPDYPWTQSFAGELLVYYRGTASRVFQTLYVYVVGSNDAPWIYHRQQTGANTWSAWYKAPTREEMDAVSTVETITAEVNTDEVTSTGWSIVIKKVGNVVSINGYAVLANPTKTNAAITLATLPQSVRPSVAIRTTAAVAAHAYEQPEGMCYAGVGTNGVVDVRLQANNLARNNTVYMSISYII